MGSLKNLINEILSKKNEGQFPNYIDRITFPFYANLGQMSSITFDFPLTVFIGPNGCGKSTVLYALYGAVRTKTPRRFWFSSSIDNINDNDEHGIPHCFFYEYKKDNQILEVLKTRINLENDPDYWETSRPIESYGMKILPEGKRNPPISKNVIYIDFRGILSSFDKYMYYEDSEEKLINERQEYIRKKSLKLKDAIDTTSINYWKGRGGARYPQNKLPIKLNQTILKKVSEIVGKNYNSGIYLEHKFFKDWGFTSIFSTNNYNYSDAHAGSGEIAITKLVMEIMEAKQNSLILLDEPEVSLHPLAIHRLKIFLLEQIKNKKLQVIISTHSPLMLENLPSESIKLFRYSSNGKFDIINKVLPEEAFISIGHTITDKTVIYVEDILAKRIIDSIIEIELPEYDQGLFTVEIYTGGKETVKKLSVTISLQNDNKKYIILDKENLPLIINPEQISFSNKNDINFLIRQIESAVGIKVTNLNFPKSSNQSQQQLSDWYYNFIKYYFSHVHFLPCEIPEEMIWDNDNYLLNGIENENERTTIMDETDYKTKFKLLSQAINLTNSSEKILDIQEKFLKKWLNKRDDRYQYIVTTLSNIKSNFNQANA